MLHSICQQIWKTQQWRQDWKRSVFNPIPKKGNAKECSNYHTIALISHTSEVMLKILQARVQQYMNQELSDVQTRLRKGRTRDQLANICWIMKKTMEFQLSYSKSWMMMLCKWWTQYASKFGKLSSGHSTGKGQFSFQSQSAMPKNVEATKQLHSFHMRAR